MSEYPRRSKKTLSAFAPSRRELAELDRSIRKSMRKWEGMDETARDLGRGLGRRELIERVARETGATLRQVHAALAGR